MKFEQELKSYCHDVKVHLHCPSEDAARCIADIKRSVNSFLDDFPDASFKEVRDYLGDAEDVARVFRGSLAPDKMMLYQKKHRFLKRVVLSLFFAAIVISLSIAYYCITNPYMTRTETVYIGEIIDNPNIVNPYK